MPASASTFSIDVSGENFEQAVIAASHKAPVLVDFWAPWCAPCRSLKPILEKLAEEYGGRFILAKLNSDDNPELSARYGVRGIPNVKAFVGGQVVDEFSGALPEAAVREFIDELIPSPAEPLRLEALSLKAAGQPEAALAKLVEASRIDPKHEAAQLDAADLLLELGRLDEAAPVVEAWRERARDGRRAAALAARLGLLRQGGGDSAALEARIAADPADLEARLALANARTVSGDHAGAITELLEIVSRDRAFGDDAGRKGLLRLFEMLAGDPRHDDLVRDARRRLAAAINR